MSALTDKVRAKYPQYNNIPDNELEQKILTKYPQYKPLASKTLGGFAENVVKSGVNAVKDIGSSIVNVFNPDLEKNTLTNVGKVAAGAATMLIPGEQGPEQYARNVGKFYKDRYGGMENIKNTLYNDPVGAGLDVAGVVSGVGAGAKAMGLTKASKVSKVATAAKAGEMTAGEKIITRGLGNPAKQAKLVNKYGYRNVADFIKKNKLYSRDPSKLDDLLGQWGDEYDRLALSSQNTVDPTDIIRAMNDEIKTLKSGPAKYSAQTQSRIAELENRLNQFYEYVTQGQDMVPESVPVKDVTTFRRKAIDPDIPENAFMQDTPIQGRVSGTKKTRDIFRGEINKTDPNLEQLGFNLAYGKKVKPILEGHQQRASNRQLLNFSKLGSAGLGGMLQGIPGAIGGFLTEQVVNNPYFLAAASSLVDKTPRLFSRTSRAVGKAGKAGNAARLFTGSRSGQSPRESESKRRR